MRLLQLASVPAVLALAVLTGCGDEPATVDSGGSADELRGRTFVSTEVTEQDEPRELMDGSVVRMQFTDDGRLIVDAGCNTGQGDVQLDDGRLVVADYGTTEMGCPGKLNDQDSWLREFIAGEPSWRLSGNDLTLSMERTRITMEDREVAQPDQTLEGTRWTLESFTAGDPDGSVRHSAEMEKAWLRFADGLVEAHGGCNGLGGDATVQETDAGYTITFGPLIGTKMACAPEIMDVESQLAGILTGEVTATIDADQLRLSNAKGVGAVLAAKPVSGDDAVTDAGTGSSGEKGK